MDVIRTAKDLHWTRWERYLFAAAAPDTFSRKLARKLTGGYIPPRERK